MRAVFGEPLSGHCIVCNHQCQFVPWCPSPSASLGTVHILMVVLVVAVLVVFAVVVVVVAVMVFVGLIVLVGVLVVCPLVEVLVVVV